MEALLWKLFWICLAAGIVYVISDIIVIIPAAHYGVRLRFGKQMKRTLEEGLRFKIPFIDQIVIISLKLETKEIKVEFTTGDNLRLVIPGSLQWRADKDVLDSNNRNVFVRISKDAIQIGTEKDVQSKISGIGGKYDAKNFKGNIQAVSDLINSMLRLETPLHLKHKHNDPDSCGLTNCKFPDGEINADKLISFYNKHWSKIKELLDGEKYLLQERSTIEMRYGIDIVKYSLSEINYTSETQAAMEEKMQAKFRKDAAEMVMELAQKIKELVPDISDQQALNWADSILNPETPRQMISVEGDAGVLGALAAYLVDKNKKKGGK